MADEITQSDASKTEGKKDDKKKKGGFFGKYKFWMIGGGFLLLVVFFLLHKSSSGAASQSAQAQQNAQAAQSGIDPGTGYLYGSPADIAALGGSGTVSATPGPTGNTGATGATGPAGPAGPPSNGLFKLTFAQAQSLAGKKGSSNLFYTSGGKIVQGKYANDKNVTYYTTPQAAAQKGYVKA